MSDRYRTGTKLGRTLYRNNQLIGLLDDAKDAAHIVKILNTCQKLAEATDHHVLDDAVMELVLECTPEEPA
jgi:hypothetical protein